MPKSSPSHPPGTRRSGITLLSACCFLLFMDSMSIFKGSGNLKRYLSKTVGDSISEIADRSLLQLQEFQLSDSSVSKHDQQSSYDHPNTNTNTTNNNKERMAACLLVLEDSIRLTEWIAYHYTVLPLRNLILALDPKNSPEAISRIFTLKERWDKMGLTIRIWQNDSFVERDDIRDWTLGIRGGGNPRGRPRMVHDERQCQFMSQCMRTLKADGESWVLLPDSDEYLVPNYVHDDEDPSFYEPLLKWKPKATMDTERELAKPIRQRLPSLQNSSIVSFLNNNEFPPCMRLPCLYYGIDESSPEQVQKDIPVSINASSLMTLNYRKYNKKRTGDFSKAMLDLSRIPMEVLTRDECNFQHNPNLRTCGFNGMHTSGANYQASIFRLNHYHGSWEAFEERTSDFRGDRVGYYQKRLSQYGPFTEHGDDDIRPWVPKLIRKVGVSAAKALLAPPTHQHRRRRR